MIRVKGGKSVLCTHFRVATMATTRRKKEEGVEEKRRGGRERYLGDVRVKSLCCSRCYPVSPFQESRIMRPIVPGCCFCGRYGSSCATSYSWNVFAYSLMRIPPSPHSLLSLSLSCFEARRCQSFRFKTPIIDLFSKVEFLRPSWRDVWSVCIRWCWTRVR